MDWRDPEAKSKYFTPIDVTKRSNNICDLYFVLSVHGELSVVSYLPLTIIFDL